ncbi:tyrosine recombinase XerC [Pseudoalteromonas ruthenica]|uniref:tyrosine recombinase XerC n=1 Tax=Pseudoalteromonas ruthenica TaxID=151081 RepID=UPI00241BFE0A|nr:tyrosine recombinase XerC [Pseudoalteromonas ruthenica]|tara:strand:+ start:32593 stop:33525 length:933 start_codon:yes stop_codon:yes gene_type:complete
MSESQALTFSTMADTWATPVQSYSDYLRFEKQYSPLTLEQYQRQLLEVARYYHEERDGWLTLSADDIRRFAMSLRARGLSARTVSLKLSCLRAFFRYLKLYHQHQDNPAQYVKGPKFDKPLPRNLDVDQMHQLLDIDDDDPLAVRDKAMMELMYSSGLRISELVSLNVTDIDVRGAEVRVLGKGRKERIVPVGRQAISALNSWLKIRPALISQDSDALFLSQRKLRISARHVRERMREWGVKQGISAQVHPHKLRHSFASHVLESSGDLRAVQELLGHSSLSATQVYTHLDFQHLAKVYDNTHPRAKKQK